MWRRTIGTHKTALRGGIAQLGEHRLCKPRVVGSSPSTSTCQNVFGMESWIMHQDVKNHFGDHEF